MLWVTAFVLKVGIPVKLTNQYTIGLITVFGAILTGRQSGQKLHCLLPKLNFTQFMNQTWKNARIWQWIIMAILTYVCFVPAKRLIRGISDYNSSNIAFEVPLASKWWWQSGLTSHKESQLRNMPFTNLKKSKNLTMDNYYSWGRECD